MRKSREEANKEALAPLTVTGLFQDSIQATRQAIHKANLAIHRMYREVRNDRAEVNKNAELFIDQLVFDLGPEILENKEALLMYARGFVQYMEKKKQQRGQDELEAEFNRDGMKDHPL